MPNDSTYTRGSCCSTFVASASADRTVRIWHTDTGDCIQRLKGHSGFVRSVAFSHDLALVADDWTVWIWRTDAGNCVQAVYIGITSHLSFEPGNIRLLTKSWRHYYIKVTSCRGISGIYFASDGLKMQCNCASGAWTKVVVSSDVDTLQPRFLLVSSLSLKRLMDLLYGRL